jgi:hypothetical protein
MRQAPNGAGRDPMDRLDNGGEKPDILTKAGMFEAEKIDIMNSCFSKMEGDACMFGKRVML